MASIATQINIVDRMSSPLYNITSAVEQVISSLQSVDGAINQGFDTSVIDSARISVDLANTQLDEMVENMTRVEHQQQKVNNSFSGMESKVIGLIGAYAGFQGIQKIVALSDSMTQTTARLNMMNDGLQTTEELQNKIMASANRSRASYQSTADMISKLGMQAGQAFGSNDELIEFAEQLNKSFVVGGTDATGIESTMYNLTQALASGVLRGQDLNAVMSNAMPIVQNIADYLEVPVGAIRDMAAEGQLSAEVVKNAMLAGANKINDQFESIPMTWGQVWTGVMNDLLYVSQPLLEFINLLAQNWSILEPIFVGLATAVGIYTASLLIGKGVMATSAAYTAIHTAMTSTWSIATFHATLAQQGLNAALLACPITWILLIIIAVIAAIYAVVAAINKVTGSTLSATGIITGAIAVAGAIIWNIIVGAVNKIIGIGVELWNLIATFANFFANVFNDPVGAIVNLFSGMFDFILGIVQASAKLIDAVLKTDMAGAVAGFRNTVAEKTAEIVGDQVVVMEKLNASDYQFKGLEYGDAWNAGYSFGEGIDDKVGDIFGKSAVTDYSQSDLLSNVEDIANNTGDISDSISATEEDLRYLRDIAEQETINRFTTAEIKVDMTNNNNISSDMDVDGMIDHLTNGVNEAMEKAAEGV